MTRALVTTLMALPAVLSGQSAGSCAAPFEMAVQPGREIRMDIRSGDIEIVGSSRALVRVTCSVRNAERAGEVKVTFAANHLRIYGGPDHDAHFHVEVPERTNLFVRVPAGNVNVSGIVGDKDIDLHAGDLTIAVGRPEQYRVAEGSVLAGDLNADAFGITKDGLFRSFRKDNASGQYRLQAHLLAGNLTLK